MRDKPHHFDRLRDQLGGELLTDEASRILYATDASIFETIPAAVAVPANKADCRAILQFSWENNLPVIPRAAGTSLAGQCVGDGLVIDVYRHLNKITKIDPGRKLAIVQPGVVQQQLNHQLEPHGLFFPVDPSTQNRCAIGGMVGNNSWGMHTLDYGTTRDHIVALDAILSDGSEVRFTALDEAELTFKLQLKSLEGDFYRSVYAAVEMQRDLILEKCAPVDVLRNNSGYALDVIARSQPFEPDGAKFNLAPLICGSEGTLVFITSIEVKLSPIPKKQQVVCAHYNSLEQALQSVAAICKLAPSAVELLDRHILDASQKHASQLEHTDWIVGDPDAILLIEMGGGDVDRKITALLELLRQQAVNAMPVLSGKDMDKAWALRRSGLALLMGHIGPLKTVTAIEDSVVPIEHLAEYAEKISQLMNDYAIDCVFYGSVSSGLMHLRPWMDLTTDAEQQRLQQLMQDTADITLKMGGVLSAKHGDGKVRGWLLEKMLGKELLDIFKTIKRSVDPKWLLNPGKIMDATEQTPSWHKHLRANTREQLSVVEPVMNWPYGFNSGLMQCNGAGVCLQRSGDGLMCPSYRATGDEKLSTRGRSNLLRLINSQQTNSDIDHALLQQAMELCLSCKGCKKECPAGVDMSRLKAEFMQQKNAQKTSLRTHIMGKYQMLSQWSFLAGALVNNKFSESIIKLMLGFHPARSLPKAAPQSFEQWYKLREKSIDHESVGYKRLGLKKKVLLIVDPQINYYEPHIGQAAIRCLEKLEIGVEITPVMHSGRVLISQGLLHKARSYLADQLPRLIEQASNADYVLGLEPSELLTFRDEVPDLVDDVLAKGARELAAKTRLFEELMLELKPFSEGELETTEWTAGKILIHDHCHQKALADKNISQKLLQQFLQQMPDVSVEVINSGCCGMAGAFGYARENYALSMQIGELELLPAVRNSDEGTIIVANGASCRSQIMDATGQRALHPAEVIDRAIL